jgi:hypothetical protein
VRSKVDTDNITWWDQRLILTISHGEIKGWYWQYHLVRSKVDTDNITWWDQRLILTISLGEIKGWYWQYHMVRSKVDTDNITWWEYQPLISPCDIVFINLWSHQVILSVSTFDLTMWYCQYQPLISPCDIVSINLWSHHVILSVSTFDLTKWYCQYQPLISPCDIVSINRLLWYWKYYVKYIMMLLIKTITSVWQISSYIITSITAHPISLNAILVIMSVSTLSLSADSW